MTSCSYPPKRKSKDRLRIFLQCSDFRLHFLHCLHSRASHEQRGNQLLSSNDSCTRTGNHLEQQATTALPTIFFFFHSAVWFPVCSIARWSNFPVFFVDPSTQRHRIRYVLEKSASTWRTLGLCNREAEGTGLRKDENNLGVHATQKQPRWHTTTSRNVWSDNARFILPTQFYIQQSMIFPVKFSLPTKSTTSVSRLLPATLAARALP